MAHSSNVELFHKLFNIVNNALTVFGLSFIARNKSGNYQLCRKRLAYGLLICLFVFFVFHLQITKYYPKEQNIVLLLLQLYLAVVGTLMAISMIATAAINAPALAQLLNNHEYRELFDLETYSFVKVSTIQQFAFAMFVLGSCYISDCAAAKAFNLSIAFMIFLFFFFPMYNSFCLSQFFNYHYWLQRWFWNINQSLENLLECGWQASHENLIFGVLEMSHRVTIGSNYKFVGVSSLMNSDCITAAELLRLRRLHLKTHAVAKQLNVIYSSRNILLLIHHCALEIVYTYWGLRHTLEDLGEPLTAIINFYKAAFMSFVSVVSMVWPCTTTNIQAKRTMYLVQDLLAKVKGGESRVELQIFALQLLEAKYGFSPAGFFEIETKLLLSLLAVVASYLVILLQYHMMYLALHATKNSRNEAFSGNETWSTFTPSTMLSTYD